MEKIISADCLLTNLFNKLIPHNIFFDYFFSFFSLIGWAAIVWIVLAVLLVIFEEIKHKKFVLYFAISLLTATLLVDVITKNIVRRPRPISTNFNPSVSLRVNQFQLVSTSCPKDYSFPSGHAATSFAATSILTYFDKKRKGLYYTIAVLVSYSRIYLGCHFFLDVVIGGFIGYLISKTLLLNKKIWEWLF